MWQMLIRHLLKWKTGFCNVRVLRESGFESSTETQTKNTFQSPCTLWQRPQILNTMESIKQDRVGWWGVQKSLKFSGPPPNWGHQKGDMIQVAYWGPTNTGRHCRKLTPQGVLARRISAMSHVGLGKTYVESRTFTLAFCSIASREDRNGRVFGPCVVSVQNQSVSNCTSSQRK